jgi:hypothetical protein
VNLRVPLALGRAAIARVPGLSEAVTDRIREAIESGLTGPIVTVDEGAGDGVLIVDRVRKSPARRPAIPAPTPPTSTCSCWRRRSASPTCMTAGVASSRAIRRTGSDSRARARSAVADRPRFRLTVDDRLARSAPWPDASVPRPDGRDPQDLGR